MDFFVKAHLTQNLSNKKELNLKKKRLKKMLEGYKKHNTNIIKNSECMVIDPESDVSMFSGAETSIHSETQDSGTTSIISLNSIPTSDNSEIEEYCQTVKDSKSKTKFLYNPIDNETFKRSIDAKKYNKKKFKVHTKKHGKGEDKKIHKDIIEPTDESGNSSPPFESFSPTDVVGNLQEVFNDYPAISTKSFLLKHAPFANFTLNMDKKLFSTARLKKNKVKYTEAKDFSVYKMFQNRNRDYNVNNSINGNNEHDLKENSQVNKDYEDLSQDSELNEANTIISAPYKIFKVLDGCVIILKHPVKVYLHGKVKVSALGGTTEILGYTLTPSFSYELYAPHNSYALILKTMEVSNNYYGLFSKLTGLGLSVAETEDIVTTLGVHDGVLYFQKLESKKLDFVDSIFRNSLFHSSNVGKNVLDCTLYSETPRKCFYENPLWTTISDHNPDTPIRGIVCGGKGAGKSTFLKYFVNRQLKHGPVLVIDLDPGQCEFTVAGNVSATLVKEPIIGPNYTHLRTPDRMLHIGMINVMNNLKMYITAVRKLLEFCKNNEAYAKLPWIVNTMGMCNAVGLKLLMYIIFSLKPTFVLQIDSDAIKKRFECDLNPENVKLLISTQFKNDPLFNRFQIHNLDYTFFTYKQHAVSTELKSSVSPKDERYFNFLAYFGELLDKDKNAISLLGVTPYVASLKSLHIGSNVKVCESFINEVLNGKVIALCQYLSKGVNKIFTLTNEPLVCLGYGLVRGIDIDRELLYVLTPVRQLQLSQVTCIAYSDWTPEIPSDEQTLAPGTLVPYRAEPLPSQPELLQAPRRRFNPLQLLRLAKSSR